MQNIKLYYKNRGWTSQLRRLFRQKFRISHPKLQNVRTTAIDFTEGDNQPLYSQWREKLDL